jgi:phenylacetate-CoA ligase
MNPLLKKLYDFTPATVQNLLVTAFSARLDRERYGGRFPEFRALLEESQWWDRERMGRYQDERLRAIVRHAYEHVPYYRELFDHHGIRADRFNGREDLPRIPVITRETVKARLADLVSRAFRPAQLRHGHTSGTTGSPLSMYFSPSMITMNYAVMDRQYAWAQLALRRGGDRIAVLRGNVIVPLEQKKPPFWRQNYLHNQLLLSNFHMTPANLDLYFAEIRRFAPRVLDGYPSSLYVLARLLLNRNERLPLAACITSSETLFDFQREAIEKAFECRVFDYYAAAERVVFATECDRHEGHHVCEEYGYTEVLDADGRVLPPGSEGIMHGTTLHNDGMPLLRYQTMDRTVLRAQRCSCGRPLLMMDDVSTKAEDMLRLADGRLISPSVLTHPFKPLDCIEGSQLVQTDVDRLVIRLVPRPEYTAAHGTQLVRDLKARLGSDMRVEIEMCAELPRTRSGKFKWVISQVDLGIAAPPPAHQAS